MVPQCRELKVLYAVVVFDAVLVVNLLPWL
jgi:hypothetical protein